MDDVVNFFVFSYSGDMKCPLTGKKCLKHKCFEAEGKLLCEDCFHTKAKEIHSANDITCASCGTSLTDIIKGGKLGCAACYDSFSGELPYIVGSVQMGDSSMRHVGNTPSSFLMDRAKKTSREDIRQEIVMRMNSAVASQDYKQAAKMKTKVEELDRLNKESGQADLSERLARFVFDFWTN